MSFKRPRRGGLLLLLGLTAVLVFAVPASASAARILYANGHGLDETRLMTFGGHTLVDEFDGCSDAEWADALARTDYDVLVVGENAPGCLGPDPSDLSSETLQAIGNYVRAGKPIVILGAHGDENDFMNVVFGFSMTNQAEDSSESLSATLQPSAAGTPFAGGPPSLVGSDLTEILGDTPGTTIYSGPEGVWVFTAPVGSGVVTYVGWDGSSGSESALDDWYRVIDRALQVRGAVPTPAAADVCMGQKATVIGTSGNDSLTGTPGPDVIVGLGGADKVNGLGGNDVMCGRTGKDRLKGGGGNDRIQGNKSADRLVGGAGGDQCRGGKGKDKASTCETTRALSAA
jgi:hypothetical protein